MGKPNKIKKWALLENGSIVNCYFSNGELRQIYKEGRYWYIDHDVYAHQMILYMHHRIIKFADTVEELQNDKV